MKNYTLATILSSFISVKSSDTHVQNKKLMIFDKGPLGGLSRKVLLMIFISLPFIEFAALFNPVVFNHLGIAQSIIFFIVFMSLVMIVIFLTIWRNNKAVFSKIESSWVEYFPDVDLKILFSSGVNPYSDFFKKYNGIATLKLDNEALELALRNIFNELQEENKDLLEMMEKEKSK